MSLLLADLKPCVCGSLTSELNSQSLANLPFFTAERRAQQLELEREQRQPYIALKEFWSRLNAIAQNGHNRSRFHLNLFEALICAAALRLAMRKRKPRSDPASAIPNTPEMSRRRSQLLRRVENLARQLQRKLRTEAGEKVSTEFVQRMREYLNSVFGALFHRLPKWAKPPSLRKFYQTVLDEACRLAIERLADMGIREPDAAEVRRLVRRYLTYSRRGRTGFSIQWISTNPDVVRRVLATFITESWAKQERKQQRRKRSRRTNDKTRSVAC